ncbi:site-specific integrase [Micrococcus luteus]|uniref:site-specific integrase n=1 Tax=Micrococcus luteus TaxID=1270 RepID=UPI0020CFE476|nr:site-specific integrase [Micrococcus luteus]UTT46227.1 site-specific integrase [Micrococcus luteus]
MARPSLEIGTWGNIPTPVEISPGVYRATTRFRDTDGVTRKVEARGPSRSKTRQALEAPLRARQTPASRAVTPDTRLRDVVGITLATGCRISDALALRWQDVDLDGRKLTINGAVIVTSAEVVRQDHPKSRGSVKTYTLDATTAEMLRARWERMTGLGLMPAVVFPSSTGALRDPSNYRKQSHTAREAIGFDWVTPHTFRKTVVTRVADEVGLKASLEYLGHANEAVTAGHYRAKAPEAADMTKALTGFWTDEDVAP